MKMIKMDGDGSGDLEVEIIKEMIIINMVRKFLGGKRIDERKKKMLRRKIIIENSERIKIIEKRRMIGKER